MSQTVFQAKARNVNLSTFTVWPVVTVASIFLSFVDLVETGFYIRKFSSVEMRRTVRKRGRSENQNGRSENEFEKRISRHRRYSQSSNLLSEPGAIHIQNEFDENYPRTSKF